MVGERIVPPVDVQSSSAKSASVEQAGQHLNQARQFAAIYFAAQAKRVGVAIRNFFLFGLLGVFSLIVMATVAVVSVVLVCEGAAGGIGALLGGRTWAGELIIGGIVLGAALVCAWRIVSRVRKVARRQTIASYLKSQMPR